MGLWHTHMHMTHSSFQESASAAQALSLALVRWLHSTPICCNSLHCQRSMSKLAASTHFWVLSRCRADTWSNACTGNHKNCKSLSTLLSRKSWHTACDEMIQSKQMNTADTVAGQIIGKHSVRCSSPPLQRDDETALNDMVLLICASMVYSFAWGVPAASAVPFCLRMKHSHGRYFCCCFFQVCLVVGHIWIFWCRIHVQKTVRFARWQFLL